MKLATGMLWAAVTILGFKSMTACGGDSGNAAGGKCAELSGTWNVNGACPPSSCTFVQDGCQVTLQCNDGTKASGTLNGSSLTFSNSLLQCSADVNVGAGGSPSASGSCHSSQGTCSFDAACASGACTHQNDLRDGGPGGAGGQGGDGVKPNPAPCQLRVATGSHEECDPSVCSQISDPAACCESVTDYKIAEGTMCTTGCADLQTDAKNCASCGHACPMGESCVAGSCVVLKMDAGIHGGGGGPTSAGGTSGTPPAPGTGGTAHVAADAGSHASSGGATGGGGPPGTGGTSHVAADAGTHGSSGGVHP